MERNDRPDLTGLLNDRAAIEQVARSPEAQALGELLTRDHDSAGLQEMAQRAMSGDFSSLQSLVRSITEDAKAAELLRRLSESMGKQ